MCPRSWSLPSSPETDIVGTEGVWDIDPEPNVNLGVDVIVDDAVVDTDVSTDSESESGVETLVGDCVGAFIPAKANSRCEMAALLGSMIEKVDALEWAVT